MSLETDVRYEVYGKVSGDEPLASITIFYKIREELEVIYKEAFRALLYVDYEPHEVVLIVNGLGETYDKLRKWIGEFGVPVGKRVHLVKLSKNLGFARANNVGLEIIKKVSPKTKYVVLVNDDLKPYPESFRVLKAAVRASESIAAAQGLIYFWGKKGIWYSAQQVAEVPCPLLDPSVLNSSSHLNELPGKLLAYSRFTLPTLVTGGFSIYRIEALEKCGFFRKGFFMYGEDVELPVRLWRCGYKLIYVPYPVGEHLVGGSGFYRKTESVKRKDIQRFTTYFFSRVWASTSFLNSNEFLMLPLHSTLHDVAVTYRILLRGLKDIIARVAKVRRNGVAEVASSYPDHGSPREDIANKVIYKIVASMELPYLLSLVASGYRKYLRDVFEKTPKEPRLEARFLNPITYFLYISSYLNLCTLPKRFRRELIARLLLPTSSKTC